MKCPFMKVGPDNPIARELRAARAYAGMSRQQLGAKIGISKDALGDWERGDWVREPALAMLEAVARHTGVPTSFEYVRAAKPSVTKRAGSAGDRLDGTPGASSETDDAPDAEDGAP